MLLCFYLKFEMFYVSKKYDHFLNLVRVAVSISHKGHEQLCPVGIIRLAYTLNTKNSFQFYHKHLIWKNKACQVHFVLCVSITVG